MPLAFFRSLAARCWLPLAIAVVTLWLFGPWLVGGSAPGLGDTPSFYLPLFRLVDAQWRAGHLPLWNPYDNLGMPLAAGGTASVFYPGRLLFWLPVSAERAFAAYVVVHWLLAAWGAFRLARWWQCSRTGAALAAAAYALGAPVLFQYSNVVFLVAAAWLPWGVQAVDRTLREQTLNAALGLAAVLALVTLGGDPQTAYHLGLIAAAELVWLWRHAGRAAGGQGRGVGRRLALLLLAAGLGFCLAAVQILPAWELSRRSDRALSWAARSLEEVPAALRHDDAAQRIAAGLWEPYAPDSYHARVFDYSVAPWRLLELLWPNVAGRPWPSHHHWIDAWSDDPRTWTPSLYIGLVPLLLAAAALRWRGGAAIDRGLSWLVLLALAGSLGYYGLGWLLQATPGALAQRLGGCVAPPVGGLYWWMTIILPGYLKFRYPAKLVTLAVLGLAVLAARGWDQATAGDDRRLRRWTLAVGGASALGLAAAVLVRPWWAVWTAAVPAHPLFGPFDAAGAAHDLAWACGQSLLVGGAFWLLLRGRPLVRAGVGAAAVTLAIVDLVIANGWMVVSIPAEIMRRPPDAVQALAAEGPGLRRIHRPWDWTPSRWQTTTSPDRCAEIIAWDRNTLAPNHHLDAHIANLEVYGTLMLADYQAWLTTVMRDGALPPWAAAAIPADAQATWQPQPHLPRVWIAHDVHWLPPVDERDIDAITARTDEIWAGRSREELLRRPAVESAWRPAAAADSPADRPATPPAAESCRIVADEPARVTIDVELQRPGLVVLADQYYPGWQLAIETAGDDQAAQATSPILRTNRVVRGCWLPAGNHRLTYSYRPASVMWGAALSAACWLLLGVLSAKRRRM